MGFEAPAAPAMGSSGSESEKKEVQQMSSLDEVTDPKWIAEQKGFKPGNLFSQKGSGDTKEDKTIFMLVGFKAAGVTFTQVSLFEKKLEQKTVSFDALHNWLSFKGKLQEQVPQVNETFMADGHPALKTETQKALAFVALQSLAQQHAEHERQTLDFYFSPVEVRGKSKIAKGALTLVPATELAKIASKQPPSSNLPCVIGNGVTFYLGQPRRPSGLPTQAAPWQKDQLVSAYWWAASTSVQSEANLVKKIVTVDNFKIPVYENSKVINQHDKLVVYEPAEPPAKKSRS